MMLGEIRGGRASSRAGAHRDGKAAMRVIITGGTGLIGRALAGDLARDGHDVILLSRSGRPARGFAPGIRVARWDGRSAQGWASLADGSDAIINLAGENLSAGRWTQQRKRAILESRTNAGAAVVDAVLNAHKKPRVVVQSSAVGYYGSTGDQLLGEHAAPGKDFLARVCWDWEASTEAVEAAGVRRVIARTGVVLSPASGALPRMLLPFKLFVGGPLGSGRQWMSWIHLEDQVHALRFLIDTQEARGAYNLSAIPLTNREFARVVGKVMRRPAFFALPAAVIRLVFGEMGTVLLDGQRVSAKRLENQGFQFRFPEAETALRDLLGPRAAPADKNG
jgi:uncharacterized protein (TIGR01777 family)